MAEVVIAAAVRTAVGSFNGALCTVPAHDLGKTVIAEALQIGQSWETYSPLGLPRRRKLAATCRSA